jgi:alkanesulfonate monooxygenase SsuD/methylene tetrahydromethanopterin reductase-like flavin-dependent oxidoreductase (luciferase family)
LVFAGAAAARTRRVRIGTAVVLAPLHHVAEIAEQAALVDVVSGGRLDLGLGAGYRRPEFELFDTDFDGRFAATGDCVRRLRRLWADEAVTPAPVQEPLPIWLGSTGPRGARRAGILGEGLLSADPDLVDPYRAGLIDGGHDPSTARMAGWVSGFVTDDPHGDWLNVRDHLAYQFDSYGRYAVEGAAEPAPPAIDPDRMRRRGLGASPLHFLLSTPEEAARQLRQRFAGTPVTCVFVFAGLPGMSEELTARHVELICTRLAPALGDP